MGKSINCNSFRGKFDDFLRVRTEILNDLSLRLRETLLEELGSNHIARNHLICEIFRVIRTVLMNSNPPPRDLAMVLEGIPRASRNHTPFLISTAVNMNLEHTLFLHMNPIGLSEETLTTAPKKRRDPQTEDELCGSKDEVHYFNVIDYL